MDPGQDVRIAVAPLDQESVPELFPVVTVMVMVVVAADQDKYSDQQGVSRESQDRAELS